MLSESHFPEMWTDFFSHSCIRITVRASDFLLRLQRYNIFLEFASVYLISFFSLTFFIIHKVYYTLSNYPEIFLQPRKYFSLVREILWV